MKKQILNLGKELSKAELKSITGGSGTCTVYKIIGNSTWSRNYYSSGDEVANAESICSSFTALGGGRQCAYDCGTD